MLTIKTIMSRVVHYMNNLDEFLTVSFCYLGFHNVERLEEKGFLITKVDYVCQDCKHSIHSEFVVNGK